MIAVAVAAAAAKPPGEGEGGGSGNLRARLRMTTEVDGSKLPANCPKPDGVTYRPQLMAGPSQVVDGTDAGNLDHADDAYESRSTPPATSSRPGEGKGRGRNLTRARARPARSRCVPSAARTTSPSSTSRTARLKECLQRRQDVGLRGSRDEFRGHDPAARRRSALAPFLGRAGPCAAAADRPCPRPASRGKMARVPSGGR